MISVKQLLRQSMALLRAHPILLVPPLLADSLIAMLAPGRGPGGLGGMILAALIQLAVTAGWLSMVATLHGGEQVTWDGFVTSIGRHFWSLVGGAFNQVLALLALGFPLLLLGALWVGQSGATRLESELRPFLDGKAEIAGMAAALSPEAMRVASQLTFLGLIWLVGFALMSFALIFWQQGVVLRHLGWLQSWKDSLDVLKRHFKGTLALLTVLSLGQGLVIGLALLMPRFGILAAALAAMALLVVRIFASVATTLFYLEAVKTSDDRPPSLPALQP